MSVIIVDDEVNVAKRISRLLSEIDPEINILEFYDAEKSRRIKRCPFGLYDRFSGYQNAGDQRDPAGKDLAEHRPEHQYHLCDRIQRIYGGGIQSLCIRISGKADQKS